MSDWRPKATGVDGYIEIGRHFIWRGYMRGFVHGLLVASAVAITAAFIASC